MKNFISSIFIILVATIFVAIMPTEAEAMIYEDTIRLHILANSDSEYDQAIKLSLRDKILEKYGSMLANETTKDDAECIIISKAEEIKAYADDYLAEYGYSCEISLEEEWYDTRYYDGFALPKGYYTSLVIKIGEGEGKNWWCVMYPPMCLGLSTSKVQYSPNERDLILGKYNVKFKILEFISEGTQKKRIAG